MYCFTTQFFILNNYWHTKNTRTQSKDNNSCCINIFSLINALLWDYTQKCTQIVYTRKLLFCFLPVDATFLGHATKILRDHPQITVQEIFYDSLGDVRRGAVSHIGRCVVETMHVVLLLPPFHTVQVLLKLIISFLNDLWMWCKVESRELVKMFVKI